MMTYQSADCRDFTPAERISLPKRETTLSAMGRLFAGLKKRWECHKQRRIDRAAFRHMLTLNDEILDDIGVTRANVEWASQLPLHMSASRELEQLARYERVPRRARARPKQRP